MSETQQIRLLRQRLRDERDARDERDGRSVNLVCLVCLVERDEPDRPDRPDEPDIHGNSKARTRLCSSSSNSGSYSLRFR